ncbi:hypothetical protein ANN_01906 [Periplaneta americana]|uniref:Uncharacterized protein n=1 Tax=Periplaneta americana TaxID=6978 RepID=A0ABQ8TX79_PERAM|nr:hypothetical protein ANN_01906 [Periplaneta americana]
MMSTVNWGYFEHRGNFDHFAFVTDGVVLYGCETWTLTLREEHKLTVFENKILRKIFGAKRDEVTGEWRKLHNTELHALYSSPDIIRNIKSRRLRWAGHVARMGESRNAYRVLLQLKQKRDFFYDRVGNHFESEEERNLWLQKELRSIDAAMEEVDLKESIITEELHKNEEQENKLKNEIKTFYYE